MNRKEETALVETKSKARVDNCVEIWTDGACSGNPGPGGWGVVIRVEGCEDCELSGGERYTTNNKMELTAAIEALKSLPESSKITLTTDSQYMKQGITVWIHNWKQNGWKTASRKPVLNKELWLELDMLCERHSVQWEWIPGHAGHLENERCDTLAKMAIEELRDKDYKDGNASALHS